MRPAAITSSLLLHSAMLYAALRWGGAVPGGGPAEDNRPALGFSLVQMEEAPPVAADAAAEVAPSEDYTPSTFPPKTEAGLPLDPITQALSEVIAATPAAAAVSPPSAVASPRKARGSRPSGGGAAAGTGAGGGGSFQPPRYLSCPPASYPAEARALKIEGAGLLRIEVDAEGRPTQVTIRWSTGSTILDSAAVRAAWAWRFEPARLGGRVVTAPVEVPVRFRCQG